METYEDGATVSYVAQKYGISPSQLFNWRRTMEEGAITGVGAGETHGFTFLSHLSQCFYQSLPVVHKINIRLP